jgi:hypothetical protein
MKRRTQRRLLVWKTKREIQVSVIAAAGLKQYKARMRYLVQTLQFILPNKYGGWKGHIELAPSLGTQRLRSF